MTPAGLLQRLRRCGYVVALTRGRLVYRYTGQGDPPAGAAALLRQLPAHRAEVIALLQRLERHPRRCPRCGGPLPASSRLADPGPGPGGAGGPSGAAGHRGAAPARHPPR
jgi:hypothetical protein